MQILLEEKSIAEKIAHVDAVDSFKTSELTYEFRKVVKNLGTLSLENDEND